MSRVATSQEKLTSSQARVLVLLVISVCINYIDRGTLSVAAPSLRAELNLDPTRIGLLLSSFFWTYALCQIGAGWLADRLEVKWVYGLGYFVWSLATLATGFVHSFATLFGFRLLLGIGESVAYPSYSSILSASFPLRNRGLANAMIDAGSKTGPALGTLLGGLIVAEFGWRSLFLSIGFLSMLWLFPWAAWAPRRQAPAPTHKASAAGHSPSLLAILLRRDAWGTFFGLFGVNYIWYFLLTWLPSYLVDERHFSKPMMAVLGSIPFWGVALSSLTGGWLSDLWIARGGSPTRVRKFFAVTGLLLGNLVLPAAFVENRVVCVILITLGSLSLGLCTSNLWAITQTLAGPTASGKWTGLQNAFGNLAGVVAPYLTGWIISHTLSYQMAFVAAAAAVTTGALSFQFAVGQISPVSWTVDRRLVDED